ncbi:MAG: LptM family lipoprotein [Eubacteriales bacterium]
MKKVFALAMSLILMLGLTGCGQKEGDYDGSWAISQIASTLNKSIKNGTTIKNMQLITEISKDTMYPKDPPSQIISNFEAVVKNSDSFKNLKFSYRAFQENGKVEEVESQTSYKGFYINVFYPSIQYNEVHPKTIKKIKISEDSGLTKYIVEYKATHYSRRYEWEYADVLEDYEVFVIDSKGIIVDYQAITKWKKDGLKHTSDLRAKVVSYELFD